VLDPEFTFSLDRGLLLLSDATRLRLNVSTVHVTISSDSQCLGAPLLRSVLESFGGYYAPTMSAIFHAFGGRGFVRMRTMSDIVSMGAADGEGSAM
jgi:hypothetical protein